MKNYDVIIVGAGINGCSLAFELHKAGQRVLVLEQEAIASGGSGAAGAFINPKISKSGPLKELIETAYLYSLDFYTKNFSDFTLINTFIDQDFTDAYNLFVVGKRLNPQKGTYEYYIKSRKAEDYKQMMINSLYHPPQIKVNTEKTNDKNLYLIHQFEKKQLYKDFILETLIGIEYLWGGQVQLETTEIYRKKKTGDKEKAYEYKRVLYTIKDKKVSKQEL